SPQNLTDLDLALIAPNGTRHANTTGTTGQPDVPALLDVPGAQGTWQAEVSAKAGAEQEFRLFVVLLRPAFSLEELREARDRFEDLGPLQRQLEQARGFETTTIQVAGVVTREDKGGFARGPAVFLPMEALQGMLGRQDQVNLIRVSNPGDVREGVEQTGEVMPALGAALNATQAGFQEPSVQALVVQDTKRQLVEGAEKAGEGFTRFLTTLSSFTIMAGMLLVVNLFTMLGEERRIELSVMRALGLHRRHLVGSLSLEGLLYALPGAPIGAAAGIALAWVLIRMINAFALSQDQLPIPFVFEPWTPFVAAGLGIVFTVAAVTVTGARLSQLHIASGLKGLPDPETSPFKRYLAPVMTGTGALLTLGFLPTGQYVLLTVGVTLLLLGATLWLGRSWPAHRARFVAALLIIPYHLWTIIGWADLPSDQSPVVGPIRGTIMVLMAVVLLLNLPGLARGVRALGRRFGRWAPATMVALAYPIKKQGRTGLTASMFALVLLVLAVFSSFFNVFQVDPAREAGGYDLYAETTLPIEDLEAWADANLETRPSSLDRVGLQDTLAVAQVFGGDVVKVAGNRPNYQGPPIDWFYGIDAAFARNNGYELVSRQASYASDQEAYEAVAQGQGVAIVSRVYDFDEVGRLGVVQGGETLSLDLASTTANFTVAGAQAQLYLGGIFLDKAAVQDLFPAHGTAILLQVQAGEDPVEVARALERDFQELGLDVESIEQEAKELQELNARFFTVLQVFLGLGLVIGVSSLGIVTAKSALEREHELGVLRAMGLPQEHITWSLLAESLFTAILGIIPGIGIGVAVAYAAYLAFFSGVGVPFTVPWASILWLSLISLVAGVLSTILPARRAARTDVASAVRVQL
ncbi:MAG: FtsX-like permease family protein, partial [Candidatus Thermoplasmatota archaeon]|nr:FtsX-like permease family protein [Candidatus Thermoplasmatota archaeon]